MKLQTKATQLARRTSLLLQAGRSRGARGSEAAVVEPMWYRVMLAHPPTHQLLPRLRRYQEYVETDRKPKSSKAGMYVTRNQKHFSAQGGHLFKLRKIEYPEDRIRKQFYTNHPWELATPRNVVENDGRSLAGRDWSSIMQPGLKLSGENVVQRTLWLARQPEYAQNHGEDWQEAYKQARLEFYRLRIREHAEQEVAAEEALLFGAVFGESAIAYNLKKEQAIIDNYVVRALEEAKNRLARAEGDADV